MNIPNKSELHLWFTSLQEDLEEAKTLGLLSSDEISRAERFKFTLHRKRFIRARAALRSILSLYLQLEPQEIKLLATPNGKLYLANSTLEFNLSHSHDLAIYAFAEQTAIGIDLEKIRTTYNEKVAKRFFSDQEYASFSKLSPEQKTKDFYRIWTGKEAVVKALGEKISFSLSSFSIDSGYQPKQVILKEGPLKLLYLENIAIFPGYLATLATDKTFKQLSYWEWTAKGPKKWREDEPGSAS